MTIPTNDMAVFLTVVRQGSFGRAARSLLMSQPSVSERIAHLERRLGAPLFDRGARGTTITAAGERLVPYAQRVLGLLDEAVEAVQSVDRAPPLRVAVHVTFAHRAVPLVLSAIGESARGIKVRDAHSDEIIAMLLDDLVDLGFVLPGARPPSLRFVPLPADPVMSVCAPTHDLAGQGQVPLRALAETRVALNVWGTGATDFVGRLGSAGIAEWRRTECSDAITALRLARHHGHVAIVTASAAAEDLANGGLVRLNLRPAPRWSVPLALAYRPRDGDEASIAAVREAVGQLTERRRAMSRST